MGWHGYLLCDLESRELVCHIIGKIDKANQYFAQPERLQNKREQSIDYEAIEDFVLHDAVDQIYDKYIHPQEEAEQ